ncbi:hypothetical protein LINPERPRIM_LOCUS5077 [Linum perenne]
MKTYPSSASLVVGLAIPNLLVLLQPLMNRGKFSSPLRSNLESWRLR